MPDIRTTPQLDNFVYGPQNPLTGSPAGNWAKADSVVWPQDMFIDAFDRAGGSPGNAVYYWTPRTWSGDVEVWGRTGPGADLTEAWRLVLAAAVGTISGYSLRIISDGGAANWDLGRFDSRTPVALDSAPADYHPSDDTYVMLRRHGDEVEVWYVQSDPTDTWTQIMGATDTTYTTDLSVAMGISSDDGGNPTWEGIGGGGGRSGPPIPQYIRRTHRRGQLWTP